ncbi:helix-turn-helix domain-containing protein [Cohnella faecalis]|uniref:Helix-turn-helix domain-containing protein n=1 Tax=Cohnella faecalis TaxID=2315694 RepID=A0A398CGQ1_9BACL|nr:helix-turn-helix domain-containing protein [Cohnella faecalis]RIE01132.1 helix-turn-helix domain-containing protein [Cohnella faecalis]
MSDSISSSARTLCLLLDSIEYKTIDRVWHPERKPGMYMLIAVASGQGALDIAGANFRLKQGHGCLIEPDLSAAIGGAPERAIQAYLLGFRKLRTGDDSSIHEHAFEIPAAVCSSVPLSAEAMFVLQDLLEHKDDNQPHQQLKNHIRFQQFMLPILFPPAQDGYARHSRDAVREVISDLDNSFVDPVDIDGLAQRSGIGKRYFNQLFRELTGTSVTEYVTSLRMNSALRLLSRSDANVKDVARTVGYSDEYYFNRRFKMTYGIAPGQYSRSETRRSKLFATQYLGHLLTLGVKPVGATSNIMTHSFLRKLVAGIESVDILPSSPSRVSELMPDLIIGCEQSDKDLYASIAPVMVMPYGERDAVYQLERLAEMLDKQKEAKRWKEAYERKSMRLKRSLDGTIGRSETVSVIEIWEEGIFAYGNRWGRGGYNLYNALELKAPAPVERHLIDNEPYRRIELEELPDYAGDHVFLTVYAEGGGERRANEIKRSAIWRSLPAVIRNRVYEADISLFGPGDPISLGKQLDIQVGMLLAGGRR